MKRKMRKIRKGNRKTTIPRAKIRKAVEETRVEHHEPPNNRIHKSYLSIIALILSAILVYGVLPGGDKGLDESLLGKCFLRGYSPGKVISISKTHVLLYFKESFSFNYGFRSYDVLKNQYEEVSCVDPTMVKELNLYNIKAG